MSKNIKVTIIEDHDMTRMGLSFALSNNDQNILDLLINPLIALCIADCRTNTHTGR